MMMLLFNSTTKSERKDSNTLNKHIKKTKTIGNNFLDHIKMFVPHMHYYSITFKNNQTTTKSTS